MLELDPRIGSIIFDNIPHGIFTVDRNGRITAFNRAAEMITGWAGRLGPLQNAEVVAIREALARNDFNRTRAAEDLGVSRNTLWRKMKRYGIE